jgi:hypothetical protein
MLSASVRCGHFFGLNEINGLHFQIYKALGVNGGVKSCHCVAQNFEEVRAACDKTCFGDGGAIYPCVVPALVRLGENHSRHQFLRQTGVWPWSDLGLHSRSGAVAGSTQQVLEAAS